MQNEKSDGSLSLIDVVLRRSRARDIFAGVSKVGLVMLSLVGGFSGFVAADHYKVSVAMGFIVGTLPPLLIAGLIVGRYQLVAVRRFRRTLGEQAGQSPEQILNAPLLNSLANAAAADDCLFAKCVVDAGHAGLALRIAQARHNLAEPLRPLPAAFSQVCIDESDRGFAALAEASGYTLDIESKTRARKIIIAAAMLFLVGWIAIFAWGEDFTVVVLGVVGALAAAGFAALKHRVRVGGQSTRASMMPGTIIVQPPRGVHPQVFSRHDSLLIWWINRKRLTLASAAGTASLRVTLLEGELACRAWFGNRMASAADMSTGNGPHATPQQPEIHTRAPREPLSR